MSIFVGKLKSRPIKKKQNGQIPPHVSYDMTYIIIKHKQQEQKAPMGAVFQALAGLLYENLASEYIFVGTRQVYSSLK